VSYWYEDELKDWRGGHDLIEGDDPVDCKVVLQRMAEVPPPAA